VNPFHTRELSAAELAELLTPQFRLSRMYGLSHGPRLRRLDRFWQRRLRRSDPGRGTASQYGSALIDAQLVGPAATWHPRLRSDVTSVRASDFTVTGERVNAALDLLAIAVRKP
jgi:hypothetical protein